MSVFLYSSSGTDPGSSLGQLSGSTDPISSGTYEYTANALHLDPATTYWIVATGTTPAYQGSFNWSLTTSDSYSLVGGWSIDVDTGGAGSSGDGGSSWGFFGGPTWIHRFSITATPSAVPEPATYALFAGLLVFAGMVILRGRRFVRAACRGGSAGGIAPSSRR